MEIGVCLDTRPWIWLEVADAAEWLQFRGAVGTYLLPSRAVHHYEWSWVGVSGLAVGPVDMQAGVFFTWYGCSLGYLPARDAIGF